MQVAGYRVQVVIELRLYFPTVFSIGFKPAEFLLVKH